MQNLPLHNGNELTNPVPSNDILVLSLIATGLVQLSEQIQRGIPLKYPYPIPLQRGLDRLTAIRLKRDQFAPSGMVELLTWCQHPIAEWELQLPPDAVGSEDHLLDGDILTNICESWACANPDVEAELTETQFMRSVFEVCQSADDPDAYVAFRKLLITRLYPFQAA